MTVQTAIKKAKEVGWICRACVEPEKNYHWYRHVHEVLLDPSFWKALGEVEGWGTAGMAYGPSGREITEAEIYQARMLTDLWEGKTIEQFFETL